MASYSKKIVYYDIVEYGREGLCHEQSTQSETFSIGLEVEPASCHLSPVRRFLHPRLRVRVQ